MVVKAAVVNLTVTNVTFLGELQMVRAVGVTKQTEAYVTTAIEEDLPSANNKGHQRVTY